MMAHLLSTIPYVDLGPGDQRSAAARGQGLRADALGEHATYVPDHRETLLSLRR